MPEKDEQGRDKNPRRKHQREDVPSKQMFPEEEVPDDILERDLEIEQNSGMKRADDEGEDKD